MADDFACVGLNITDDPRLVGASLAEFGLAGFLHLYADDWGRFDANPAILARRIGAPVGEVSAGMKALADRGFYRTWSHKSKLGLIGEIVGFHQFSHGDTRRYDYKRRATRFPSEDGSFPERTPHRAKDPDDAQPEKASKPKRQAVGNAGARKGKNGDPRIEEKRGEKTRQKTPAAHVPAAEPVPSEPIPSQNQEDQAQLASALASQRARAGDGMASLPARAQAAMASWLAALPRNNPHAKVEPSALVALAEEVGPEVFVRAVERHIDAPDWWLAPLRLLRERCGWVAEDIAKEAKEAAANAVCDAIIAAREPAKMQTVEPRASVESRPWFDALREIYGAVEPYDFKHWISRLRCVGQDDGDGVLTLEAPDESHVQWILDNFSAAIEEAARPFRVEFVVA